MSKYIGRLVKVGVGRETTRGAGASPDYLVPHTSFSFDDKVVNTRSDAGLGRIEDSEEMFVTTKYGQGEIEGEIRASSFGLLLYSMLGSLSTTGPVDSAYTHAFSVANTNQHQSLSLVVEDSNTSELYKLVMLNSLELKFELDAVSMFTADFISKKGNSTGLAIPSPVSEYKFTKKHLSVKFADNLAALSGATSIAIKSLSLKISKNVLIDDVIGTAEPEDLLNQQLQVEGELTLNYEDQTYKDYMRNGTQKAMEIALTNTDETIGSGTNPSLTIQMPLVDFFEWEPDNSLNDIVKQTFSFKGNYDVANGSAIISTCSLVNTVISY